MQRFGSYLIFNNNVETCFQVSKAGID